MTATSPTLVEAMPVGARLTGFIDHLRMNQFKIGPSETRDVVRHLATTPVATLGDARRELKILLSSGHEDWQRFDDLFEAYWIAKGRRREFVHKDGPRDSRSHVSGHAVWREHFDAGPESADQPGVEQPGDTEIDGDAPGRLIASDQTVRMRTDLRHFTDPREIAEAEQLAYRLARAMRYRLSRRYRRATGGTRIDLRRTIRANLSHGGDPLTLVRKAKPDRPVRITVLLDVSGSMKAYSRFFLEFVKGMVCHWIDTDAYLFHTKLMRVTDVVRERDALKAMTNLSLMADGFGGGTKLGASLARFNTDYAKRTLNSRSVVIILSDGYDTGPAATLARELAQLKRRAPRLIWLNPLLGWRHYQPVTAAMEAALPYIDHFAAANTLESLAAIEHDLARL